MHIMTKWENQILTRAIGIQKKIGGSGVFYSDNKARIIIKAFKGKAMYGVFSVILNLNSVSVKMCGYPQLLTPQKYPCISRRNP